MDVQATVVQEEVCLAALLLKLLADTTLLISFNCNIISLSSYLYWDLSVEKALLGDLTDSGTI